MYKDKVITLICDDGIIINRVLSIWEYDEDTELWDRVPSLLMRQAE